MKILQFIAQLVAGFVLVFLAILAVCFVASIPEIIGMLIFG